MTRALRHRCASNGPPSLSDHLSVARLEEERLPNGLTVMQLNRWETALLYKDIFEERCYLQNGVVMPRVGGIVDAGANIGLASLFFHCEAPGVPIVAVEPAPDPFSTLKTNAERFTMNATLINASLGAQRGEAAFRYYPGNTLASSMQVDVIDAAELEIYLRNEGLVQADGRVFMPDMTTVEECRSDVMTLSEVLDVAQMDCVGLLRSTLSMPSAMSSPAFGRRIGRGWDRSSLRFTTGAMVCARRRRGFRNRICASWSTRSWPCRGPASLRYTQRAAYKPRLRRCSTRPTELSDRRTGAYAGSGGWAMGAAVAKVRVAALHPAAAGRSAVLGRAH